MGEQAPKHEKPVSSLRAMAKELGWLRLRTYQYFPPPGVLPTRLKVITWYEAGDCDGLENDFFLQFNENPIGQTRSYAAAVYAIRFHIFTGWHSFRLSSHLKADASEIGRLDPWLHRRWFETSTARRDFRNRHPECVGYSWKRIRQEGPQMPPEGWKGWE